MTVSSLLPVRISKEIRGLSLAWLACLVSMAVAAALGGRMRSVGLVAYFLGAVALGALSVGHEYTCRTLTLLLSQPARRERLYVEKLSVLAVMLAVLCAVAWLGLFDPGVLWGFGDRWARNWWFLAFGLPLLCGLFVAPWLTMVCRNAVAGIVFALAIPATVWIASDITAAMKYGGELAATVEAREFALEIFWRGVVIVCVLAAVAGWWTFMRLETIDSGGLEVRLPSWLFGRTGTVAAAPVFARRRAMWLLVRKELRLQQLTFAVSGLYLLGWVSLVSFRPMAEELRTTLLYMLTIFHSGAIPLLAGSLASAEERQLGTLEGQLLLPMARWKQWSTKAGAALVVALALTWGLPALLLYIAASPEIHDEGGPVTSASIRYAVVAMVVTSLYVSSVCPNGLRALLISVPAFFVTVGFTALYYFPWYWMASTMWQRWSSMLRRPEMFGAGAVEILYMSLLDVLAIVIYVGALGMLLRYAMTNHHSAERGTARVWKQMTSLVVFLAIGIGLSGAVMQLYRARQISVTGVTVDGENNPVKDYTVAIFPDAIDPGNRRALFPPVNPQGEFRIPWLPPGRYSLVAVAKLENKTRRDSAVLERLKALAKPVTLAPGDSKVISLTLSKF